MILAKFDNSAGRFSCLKQKEEIMMQKDTIKIVFAAGLTGLLLLSLSGCGQKTVKLDQAEETAKVEDTVSAKSGGQSSGNTETVAAAKVGPEVITEGAGAAESLDTAPSDQDVMSGVAKAVAVVAGSRTDVGLLPIYFDFDQSIVAPEQVERLATNALFLQKNPDLKVRIEGNCDDRGTSEYNMVLGERRAMSAMKYLVNLGIDDSRLSTLSYGEERLLNPGSDEVAWAENRRDDFVVVQ